MAADRNIPLWHRRGFLQGMGASAVAFIGITSPMPLFPHVSASEKKSKLVAAWNAFDILDPHVKYDLSAATFNLNMYDNLLRYQGNPPELVPWLAASYEATNEGRRWIFHLRRGARFHDHSEITAEAVRYSFERLLALGKAPSAVFKRMGLTPDKIHVQDTYTLAFDLDQPYGPFRMAMPLVSIVNPALIKAHEQDGDWGEKWLARHEAGSGAFQLVKVDPVTGFTMERFPGFWRGWPEKYVDEVEVRVIREQSSRVMAMMKGDIHLMETNMPPDQVEKLEKHPRVKVSQHESMRFFAIRMHNQREPFTDINVRKAFSHAFNYDSFIKDIMKGRVVRNPGPMPRTLWGYPQELTLQRRLYVDTIRLGLYSAAGPPVNSKEAEDVTSVSD